MLRGRTPEVLELLLGFRKDRLAEGAAILFLENLPGVEDFQLAAIPHTDEEEYPPGSGIFKVKLIHKLEPA